MEFLDLLTILENSGLSARVENVSGMAGFVEGDFTAWVNETGSAVSVTVDDVTVVDLWKCFVLEGLVDGLCFVVLRNLNGVVVLDSFVLDEVSILSFS